MEEIEVKILEIDRTSVERKLREMGGEVSFDGEMSAVFFDFADRRISRSGGVLRLRREGLITLLTHKSPLPSQQAKVMHETQTEVSDFEAMREILLTMGLEVIKSTRKHRIQYDLQGGHVVIDDYKEELASIPIFLEIEAPSLDQLHRLIHRLGYKPEDTNRWNTYDLVRYYLGDQDL